MDWILALQDYPIKEIQAACVAAVRENPNKMPNEGHIRKAILAERSRKLNQTRSRATQPSESNRTDPKRAAEVSAELGLKVIKRMGEK